MDYVLTSEQMQAIARVPMERVQQLAGIAERGLDPGELSADDRLVYEAMLSAVLAFPNVTWGPLNLDEA